MAAPRRPAGPRQEPLQRRAGCTASDVRACVRACVRAQPAAGGACHARARLGRHSPPPSLPLSLPGAAPDGHGAGHADALNDGNVRLLQTDLPVQSFIWEEALASLQPWRARAHHATPRLPEGASGDPQTRLTGERGSERGLRRRARVRAAAGPPDGRRGSHGVDCWQRDGRGRRVRPHHQPLRQQDPARGIRQTCVKGKGWRARGKEAGRRLCVRLGGGKGCCASLSNAGAFWESARSVCGGAARAAGGCRRVHEAGPLIPSHALCMGGAGGPSARARVPRGGEKNERTAPPHVRAAGATSGAHRGACRRAAARPAWKVAWVWQLGAIRML